MHIVHEGWLRDAHARVEDVSARVNESYAAACVERGELLVERDSHRPTNALAHNI